MNPKSRGLQAILKRGGAKLDALEKLEKSQGVLDEAALQAAFRRLVPASVRPHATIRMGPGRTADIVINLPGAKHPVERFISSRGGFGALWLGEYEGLPTEWHVMENEESIFGNADLSIVLARSMRK